MYDLRVKSWAWGSQSTTTFSLSSKTLLTYLQTQKCPDEKKFNKDLGVSLYKLDYRMRWAHEVAALKNNTKIFGIQVSFEIPCLLLEVS